MRRQLLDVGIVATIALSSSVDEIVYRRAEARLDTRRHQVKMTSQFGRRITRQTTGANRREQIGGHPGIPGGALRNRYQAVLFTWPGLRQQRGRPARRDRSTKPDVLGSIHRECSFRSPAESERHRALADENGLLGTCSQVRTAADPTGVAMFDGVGETCVLDRSAAEVRQVRVRIAHPLDNRQLRRLLVGT